MISNPVRILSAGAFAVAAILIAGFVVSDGFLNVDEVVYFLGARAVETTGGFAVSNGWSDFASRDLRIIILVEGPAGLVPQYPAGTSLAGASLIPLFGQRSLIVLNAAAGIATLFAAHALARRLFTEARVADLAVVLLVLATFWIEYVFGHWPHAVSVFCTTLAMVFFLNALDREDRAWLPAVFSGLAVGVGMLFRLDGLLLLPAVAAATVLWAARPIQILTGGAVGVLPTAAVLAATNAAKFGTWNPLTYGSGGGGTDLSGHVDSIALILAALAGLVLLRALRNTKAMPQIRRLTPVAIVVGLALALLTPLAPHVWSLARGIRAILFDATTIVDPRPGVVQGPLGTLLFWSFPKKALFQSLPWLGCLALLAGMPRGNHGRSIAIVLLVFSIWSLPFLMLSWHGGGGSNMRYLLPTLPALTALAAWTLVAFFRRSGSSPAPMVGGGLTALILSVVWLKIAPAQAAQLHQIVSTKLFVLVALSSLLAGLYVRPLTAHAALAATGAGVGLAAVLGLADLAAGQNSRALNAARSDFTDRLAGPVIFYGPPAMFAGAFGDPDKLVASPRGPSDGFDTDLIDQACAAGYRVVMNAWSVATIGGLSAYTLTPFSEEGREVNGLLELSCPP